MSGAASRRACARATRMLTPKASSAATTTRPTTRATIHWISATSTVRMEVDVAEIQWMVARGVGLGVVAALLAFGVSILVARAQARRLAAPLIYLAASAEQIGSGQVRPQLRKSGIEEIDLVAAELTRTGERLAARLAAERQFAADASHQLRTPRSEEHTS